MKINNNEISIRAYRKSDRDDVVHLICSMQRAMMDFDTIHERDVKEGYGESTLDELLKAVSKKSGFVYVVDAHGSIVGYVNGSIEKPSEAELLGRRKPTIIFGEVDMIYIQPEYRRKGISIMLMKKAEELLKKHGCTVVLVNYYAANKKARIMYNKLGYKMVGMSSYKKI